MADVQVRRLSLDADQFQGEAARKIRDWVRNIRNTNDKIHNTGISFMTGQLQAQVTSIFTKLNYIPAAVEGAMEVVAIEILRTIIARTPIENPPTDNIVASLGWDMRVTRSGTEVRWIIQNDTKGLEGFHYVIALEYGWSKQAPRGMVRITIEEFRSRLRDAVAAAVREGISSTDENGMTLVQNAVSRVQGMVKTDAEVEDALHHIEEVMAGIGKLVPGIFKRALNQTVYAAREASIGRKITRGYEKKRQMEILKKLSPDLREAYKKKHGLK